MKRAFIAALMVSVTSGCSVFMAAKKQGTEISDLATCRTKTCLMAKGAEPLSIKELPENIEAYKVLKPQGSIGRAVLHGVLDVATWGLWEVAGTPIEGHYNKDKYYAIRVTYESGTENIKQIALAE